MRRGRFCPQCGRDEEKLYNGLCSDCFLKRLDLSDKVPDKVVLGTCKSCGNIFIGEKKFSDVEGAVEGFLQSLLKQKEIESATYRVTGERIFLTIDLKFDGLEKQIEKGIPIVNKSITCRFCSLKKASYYNVTIQVRVPKDMEDKIVREIEDEVSRLSKRDNYSFISGMEKLKEGTDLFLGSKSAAEHAVKLIQRRYGAETKFSRKLYGLVEGKKSYRDTMLVSIKKSD